MNYGRLRVYLACVVAEARTANGQALGEYALVLAFVAAVAAVALAALGAALPGFWEPLTDIMG